MASVITGEAAAMQLLEALGIPAKNVSDVQLVTKVGEICHVRVTRFVTDDEMGAIIDRITEKHHFTDQTTEKNNK